MRGISSGFIPELLFMVLACAAVPIVAAEDFTSAREVEIFRYEVAPRVMLGQSARDELSAMMPFGEFGIDAYVVVVHMAPGERFVSARAEVRDGFFCILRRQRGRSIAGRMAARLGYEIVLHRVPPEIRNTLALVPEVFPLSSVSALPPPRLKRRVSLKARNVEHHDGYVAVLLLVAANPVTRLQVERVVTRSSARGGKRRSRGGRTVAFPDPTAPPLPRERIMSILAGEGNNLDRGPPF